jgi:hypothetical protein
MILLFDRLSREKETDVWQPLRKADSKFLNENPGASIVRCGFEKKGTIPLTGIIIIQ